MMITWKRAAGSPDGETIVYEGTSPFLVSYQIHSVRDGAGPGRIFLPWRMRDGRIDCAVGTFRFSKRDAQRYAEDDLRAVLRGERGPVLVRPLTNIAGIGPLYEQASSKVRWEWRAEAYYDHFPIDEPLVDMFMSETNDQGCAVMVCPCGGFEIDVHALTLADIHEFAQQHSDEKHGGR